MYAQLTSTHLSSDNIVGHTTTFHKNTFRRLPPPPDPTSPPSSSAPTLSPVPRVLNPGLRDKNKDSSVSGSAGAVGPNEVYVGWLEGVPESHIVFPNMLDGVHEWDLVR